MRRAYPWCVGLVAAALLASGCGVRSTVSGKVTLGGQAVAGTVTFIGAEGKEFTAPINPDGTYTLTDTPAGAAQVVVKCFPGTAAPLAKRNPKLPQLPGTFTAPPAPGVLPPARYAAPNNGLTLVVTGGRQTFDIELVR
jgi:hypothetical protein